MTRKESRRRVDAEAGQEIFAALNEGLVRCKRRCRRLNEAARFTLRNLKPGETVTAEFLGALGQMIEMAGKDEDQDQDHDKLATTN